TSWGAGGDRPPAGGGPGAFPATNTVAKEGNHMRTKTRVALAAAVACALTIGTTVPAGAQQEPEALGFAVDKTQAPPGALVLGKVDTDDVAEHCTTEVEAFQQLFLERTELLLEVFYGQNVIPDE